jgi:hypothetical protein
VSQCRGDGDEDKNDFEEGIHPKERLESGDEEGEDLGAANLKVCHFGLKAGCWKPTCKVEKTRASSVKRLKPSKSVRYHIYRMNKR